MEELYISMKIQVLIATSTVAWGVNFPTHLVVVKGTEFYDGKLKRYVDMPITDVVSMWADAAKDGIMCHAVPPTLADISLEWIETFIN